MSSDTESDIDDFDFTQQEIALLTNIRDQGIISAETHVAQASKYGLRNTVLNVVIYILLGLTSVDGIILMSRGADATAIVFFVAQILLTVCYAFQDAGGIADKAREHENASLQHSKVVHEINVELSKRPQYRTRANIFIDHIKQQILKLKDYSPRIEIPLTRRHRSHQVSRVTPMSTDLQRRFEAQMRGEDRVELDNV